MPESQPKPNFQFSGGNLVLDFTNTVDNRGAENEIDLLTNYSDLLAWALAAKLMQPKTLDSLSALAIRNPSQSRTAFRRAVQLREAIYDLFSSVAHHSAAQDGSLPLLNWALQHALEHSKLVRAGAAFASEWISPESNLNSILWPIARDAAELLTSGPLDLVRMCAAENCGWLFLDTTKNHRRRWCDMKTCGNRNKARRYYHKAQR